MGLDLWFKEDVARTLTATYETMQMTQAANPASNQAQAQAYYRGFTDALRTVAVAFGVAMPSAMAPPPQVRLIENDGRDMARRGW